MKKLKVLGLGILGALLLAGCSGKAEEAPAPEKKPEIEISTSKDVEETKAPEQTEPAEDIPEGMVKSYLTGEAVPEAQGRRRPVAIMLNNIQDAVPQTGISRAGVVYEAPVEGDITRLMGIFENYDDLTKIGSVRSCREYYIFYALEFDAIYAHYGQAVYAEGYLAEDFVHNLSGLSDYGEEVYYRTSDRKAPHNAYTSFEGIQKGISLLGYSQEYKPEYQGHYQFAKIGDEAVLQGGTPANVIRLDNYKINHPWFEYNPETKKYNRFQYGGPQIDDMTGEQLAYDNVIIQYASYKPYDQNGYLNIDPYSGGKGKFITRGQAIDVRWEKDAVWGVTHYYDSNEKEIQLNTGKTWVCIVLDDSLDKITYE